MGARRSELAWGLVVPLLVVVVLTVMAPRTDQPAAWLALAGAMPMFAAMFSRALFTGIVALATVLACGFSAASAYGTRFTEALPVLVGVIVLSGAAVLVAQAKSPVAPRPAPAPAGSPATLAPPPDDEATVDDLTGLPTRRGIRARLGEEQPSGHRVVALVDCDHLAALNEEHGRAVGDTFVFAVAGRTRYALTEPDVVARWADQQFLVVLHTDLEQSLPTLTLITDKVNQNPIRTDSGLIPATMSVGATAWAVDEDLETAVARARQALYRSKVEGGGRLVVEA